MIEVEGVSSKKVPQIYVIGIGGGGNNAIRRMVEGGTSHVKYVAVNTDVQVLDKCPADEKVQIGRRLTNGYGAGSDPSIGAAAAKESEEEIVNIIKEANMVILTCGMGGGTGTGAIPVIAGLCKENGVLTVAVVTEPFSFEGTPRLQAAKAGVEELKNCVDTLLVIPNDKLLSISDKPFMLSDAFLMADSVLKYAIEGISNIIFNDGVVNLDFNDLHATLMDKGIGHFGIGSVNGNKTLMDAVKQAVNSPLLETSIKGASNILFNTSGNVDIMELNEAVSYLGELAGEGVNIIWGTVTDEANPDDIVVTLIATGILQETKPFATGRISPYRPGLEPEGPFSSLGKRPESPELKEIVIPTFLTKYDKR